MEREDVARWLDDYVEAWKTYDPDAIAALFSGGRRVPLSPVRRADSWPRGRGRVVARRGRARGCLVAGPEGTYDASYEPVAIDGDIGRGHGLEHLLREPGRPGGEGLRQLLRDALRRRRPLPRVHRVVHRASRRIAVRVNERQRQGHLLRRRRRPLAARGQDDRDPRLRLAGPRARAQPEGLGLRGRGRPAPGLGQPRRGRGGGPRGARRRRGGEPRRRRDDPAARREAGRGLGGRDPRRDRARATC